MVSPQPTLAGFTQFVRDVMGISATVLPDNSIYLPMALAVAMSITPRALMAVPVPQYDAAQVALNQGGLTIYVLAVYNLAGDNLINYAQDLTDAAIIPGSVSNANPQGLAFFAFARFKYNVNGSVSGVVQASSDESTSVSMVVQEAAKNFTIANLQQLKTPWGRQYLAFAQSLGQNPFGIS